MRQDLKSERSRRQILDSALRLFSHKGFGATTIRAIAERAHVSTGSVYHHFPDKEAIYQALFEEYRTEVADPEFPLNRALASGSFPDDLEQIGRAAERTVHRYRDYLALIYVDVVEFDGSHIRKFHSEMSQRFQQLVQEQGREELESRLRPGVSPALAVMLATRFFLDYFSVEILFGVKNPFGKASEDVIREIAGILRRGMLRDESEDP